MLDAIRQPIMVFINIGIPLLLILIKDSSPIKAAIRVIIKSSIPPLKFTIKNAEPKAAKSAI